MTLEECEEIFVRALTSKSEEEFHHAVAPLFSEYEILSLSVGRGSVYWRTRRIDVDAFPSLEHLDYPPPHLARQGRLNDAGSPCFYVATHNETALAEINAAEGDLVQLAGFRVLAGSSIRLAVIGEYANVQKNGYMHFSGFDPGMTIARLLNSLPRQEALKKIYIDRFFASVLADPHASSMGYMLSRALAKAIYARINADGIVFPSVKDKGGFNIAIQAAPSDRSLHNVSCLIVRMGKGRQFGLVDFTLVGSAERLDENSNFIWKASAEGDRVGYYNMTKEEYDAASSDPNDRNAILKMTSATKRSKKQNLLTRALNAAVKAARHTIRLASAWIMRLFGRNVPTNPRSQSEDAE